MTQNETLKKQIEVLKVKHQEYLNKSNQCHLDANVFSQQAFAVSNAIDIVEKALLLEAPKAPWYTVECQLLKMEGGLGLKRKDGKSLNDPTLPTEFVVRIVD